jgi:hypothetical protein
MNSPIVLRDGKMELPPPELWLLALSGSQLSLISCHHTKNMKKRIFKEQYFSLHTQNDIGLIWEGRTVL